jgi:hypothetical protein
MALSMTWYCWFSSSWENEAGVVWLVWLGNGVMSAVFHQ